jgi:hypothetical protein
VFDNVPAAVADTVPFTVKVAETPAFKFTVVLMLLPVPVAAAQLLPPPVADVAQIQVTPVMSAGTVSLTVIPVRLGDPVLFVTTMVYVIAPPRLMVVALSVLVTEMSAAGLTVVRSLAVLLALLLSPEVVTVAVLVYAPVAVGFTVRVIALLAFTANESGLVQVTV